MKPFRFHFSSSLCPFGTSLRFCTEIAILGSQHAPLDSVCIAGAAEAAAVWLGYSVMPQVSNRLEACIRLWSGAMGGRLMGAEQKTEGALSQCAGSSAPQIKAVLRACPGTKASSLERVHFLRSDVSIGEAACDTSGMALIAG